MMLGVSSRTWAVAQESTAAAYDALETASWIAGILSLVVAVYGVLAARSAKRRTGPDRLSPDRPSPDRPRSDRPSPDRPGAWPERRIATVRGTGGAAGRAVVVGPDLVVTCAHVVNLALGRPRTDPSPPTAAEVDLEFPLARTDEHGPPRRRAVLETWSPRPDRFALTDIAVLRMTTPLAGAAALALDADDPRGPVQFWVSTAQHPDGEHVTGRLPGAADSGRLQVSRDADHPLRAVDSGGPVWRPEDGMIVGLLQVDEDAVHVLPSELVRAAIGQPAPGTALAPGRPAAGTALAPGSPAPGTAGRVGPALAIGGPASGSAARVVTARKAPQVSRRTALTAAGLLAVTAGGLGYAWQRRLADDWPPDWPTGPHDYGKQDYLSGGDYQLTVETPGHALRARAPVTLDTQGLRIAATARAPMDQAAWGLWCGDADGGIRFELGVHPDGKGYINVQNGPNVPQPPPRPRESPPEFRPGRDNRLEAECVVQDSVLRMTLTINGVPAVRYDQPGSGLGAVTAGVYGVLAAGSGTTSAQIRFRDFDLTEVG